jgi:hypothetical protein
VQLCNEVPTKSSAKDVRCHKRYEELHNTWYLENLTRELCDVLVSKIEFGASQTCSMSDNWTLVVYIFTHDLVRLNFLRRVQVIVENIVPKKHCSSSNSRCLEMGHTLLFINFMCEVSMSHDSIREITLHSWSDAKYGRFYNELTVCFTLYMQKLNLKGYYTS